MAKSNSFWLMVTTKWNHAMDHLVPSIKGFTGLFFRSPGFAIRLFLARLRYFATGGIKPVPTPERYVIESPSGLLCYWGFFVEHEGTRQEWVRALRTAANPVIVDVGANAGIFSHYLWTYNNKARFVMFEPMPRLAKKIQRWGELTGANYKLHNAAVSNRTGTATFYATSEEGDTAGSLDPAGNRAVKIETPLVTLDSVLAEEKEILILKIDVEGFEPDVLRGATETLRRSRFLLMEAHGDEALATLQSILGPEWLAERVGAADYFFLRQNDPCRNGR